MSKDCHTIHLLFNSFKRHTFPFDEKDIPENGIYILFERGESGHSQDRIVRVGTHTGVNQLRSRLQQHFINANKDRSIFRKNIGRALLNKRGDSFLEKWELDLTTKDARAKHSSSVDFEKQREVETKVSGYIQKNFSFAVFPIENKDERLALESKIISTVSLCEECFPSNSWLGLSSPKEKIRQGGLWLVNELWKEPLAEKDIFELKKLF